MKRMVALVLLLALMLSGCDNPFSGTYSSVRPHAQSSVSNPGREASAADYRQLCAVLEEIVASCEEKAVIDTGAYDQEVLADDARRARIYAETQYPLGVYAVDWMSVRLGKSDGRSVLTVHVRYIHNRTAIQEIKQVHSEKSASFRIYDAMEQYASRLALWVKSEEEINYHRIVEEYAWNAPRTVMECPDLTVETYPEGGTERIVVLNFDYQTGVDTLRSMRDQVIPVFDRALATAQKSEDPYRALYDFLMKGYNHHITPSITPSYSLLKYGVGDSKAFAQVYAAMCREAGMECLTVHGTKNGTSHCWNIIRVGNVYYHLDLLGGGYVLYSNATLTGYVWDYAAYPVCGAPIEE